jgi:hypothetical protein
MTPAVVVAKREGPPDRWRPFSMSKGPPVERIVETTLP